MSKYEPKYPIHLTGAEHRGESLVPWCSRERCRSYDGKRCELLGHAPETVCTPFVETILGAVYHSLQKPPLPPRDPGAES